MFDAAKRRRECGELAIRHGVLERASDDVDVRRESRIARVELVEKCGVVARAREWPAAIHAPAHPAQQPRGERPRSADLFVRVRERVDLLQWIATLHAFDIHGRNGSWRDGEHQSEIDGLTIRLRGTGTDKKR